MNIPTDPYNTVRTWAVDMLKGNPTRTEDDIRLNVDKAIRAFRVFDPGAGPDGEQLVSELMHLFSISAGRATALDDPHGHEAWLPDKRSKIHWRFWSRYMTYLERDFGMPPEVVNNLHELTDMLLERLEDPERPGQWDRRGMVVGSVQSGKTANYIGFINKALDAGYKLVVVLAGIHNNLRSQTQLRVDEGVLGKDTSKNRKLDQSEWTIGVGKLPGAVLHIDSLTSSEEQGDFKANIANTITMTLGQKPLVLVIKKNVKILGPLLKWVRHVAGIADPVSGKKVIREVPLLLIDDEADNASINVKDKKGVTDPEESVSAINGRIRELLDAFDKSAYVGYTATPFANIFINPGAQTDRHGEDIFPRSFIINVKPPTNYVGPAKVFGLDGDTDSGIEAQDGLPIVRLVDDYPDAFPPGHKKDHVPGHLPESLKRAIRCFVISCAARRARGQGRKHSSMLIHVTRFISVQNLVAGMVKAELLGLQRRIQDGDGQRRPTLLEELEQLWKEEFEPVSQALGPEAGPAVGWDQVAEQLHPAASKIAVMPINGFAKEALDYKEHEAEGRSVIAVGGDKLSRGLTLEGLSISYFLRTSKMYDTLMQMGRWFGYRPGYLDLCRLFTTPQLVHWYRHIALAEAELRREFDYMVQAGLSPEKYGLRVRTHPEGMMVTALNKMCHSETLELSWAGVLVQTTQLPKSPAKIAANAATTEKFLTSLAGGFAREKDLSACVWADVGAPAVADYIEKMDFPAESARASGRQLATFIRKQQERGELTAWTVVLLSNSQAPEGKHRRNFANQRIGLVQRSPESQTATSYALRKSNILSPLDESIDLAGTNLSAALAGSLALKPELAKDGQFLSDQAILGKSLRDVAVALTRQRVQENPESWRSRKDTDVPNGRIVRELRPKSLGLLLIYPLLPPHEVPEVMKDGVVSKPAEPTGLASDDPGSPPVIGLALSFPTSDTAACVEYQVNKVWGATVQEDAEYDD